MLARVRELYEADTLEAHRFRFGLLAFDIATIVFIVATSFLPRADWIEIADILIGLFVLADVVARMAISRDRFRGLHLPSTWIDLVVVVSFLAPIVGEGAGFLRILRTLRLLRTYQVLMLLRSENRFFRRNEDVIVAATNLCVFLFVMSGIVYETQHWKNPAIANYVDALYFTVTALTTTGFGDITLQGTSGKLISVAIMIVGVTLFLRLAQVVMRPPKVRHPCPTCGLQRHEPDAVHCKACGQILNIPDDGID
ncbi:MAG: potassium channel family protein [Rhodospirillales bacterium]|jgi:voltage-gated potassium channel